MSNFSFIYKQDDKFRVLNTDQAVKRDKLLRSEGWQHLAIVDPDVWLELFLNGDDQVRERIINDI